MKLQDALNLLNLHGKGITLEQCKQAYRVASMKYHPDRNPAGLEMMKAINAAWEMLKAWDWTQAAVNVTPGANADYGDALNAAINAIIDLEGLSLEICGAWIWVSGNTRQYKAALKSAGYRWASQKLMWYFRPAEWKSANRGTWEIEKIRTEYGSESVSGTRAKREALKA